MTSKGNANHGIDFEGYVTKQYVDAHHGRVRHAFVDDPPINTIPVGPPQARTFAFAVKPERAVRDFVESDPRVSSIVGREASRYVSGFATDPNFLQHASEQWLLEILHNTETNTVNLITLLMEIIADQRAELNRHFNDPRYRAITAAELESLRAEVAATRQDAEDMVREVWETINDD